MKLKYLNILLSLITLGLLSIVPDLRAQTLDTMVVQWETSPGSGLPLKNALRNAVMTDTIPDGTHYQNRVYKLLKGGFYWNIDRMSNTGYHLRLTGEPGDPNDPVYGNPPVLQRVYDDPGTFVDDKLIVGNGDLTIENIYVIHCDDQGVQTAYQSIELSGNEKRYTFKNVIFERSNFGAIAVTNPNNDVFFYDCSFRNLIGEPSTQQWEGRGASLWADMDTVIIENCTFFNVNFTPFQLEGGAANYLRVNHNTFVNVGRQMAINGAYWREAYFANNLLINTFWHGEGFTDLTDPNRDPRAFTSGMWGILDMPNRYGPEEGRRILLANTAAYLDPLFTSYFADSIRAQPFANPITKEDFLDVPEYQMVAVDTMWLTTRPNLGTYFNQNYIVDSMIQNIRDIRAGITPAHKYFYRIPELPGGGTCNVCPSWPLPENFSYTDPNLMIYASDALPIGDLNWFPTQKADFLANKDTYISDMEALAGGEIRYPVVGEDEGEFGALSGTAVVEAFAGFSYVAFTNSGSVVWNFNMANAGTVELVVYSKSNDATRGQHIRVNGTGLRNDAGYGEYFWNGTLTTSWQPFSITQAGLIPETQAALNLAAGSNTIEIAPSWGYQDFLGVDVILGGTTIFTLRPPNANQPISAPVVAEGAAYVPHYFNTVQLGANGTITWNFNLPTGGDYGLNIFYQAPAGSQTLQLTAGGQIVSLVLEGAVGDSTGANKLTATVLLPAGATSFVLTGSNVLVDWIQFVRKEIISSLDDRPEIPNEFALSQNYPNPFNPTTKINFDLGQASDVKLIVYDILGRKVATLVNQFMNRGAYTVDFDASHFASGVYFYCIDAGDFKMNKKMILLK